MKNTQKLTSILLQKLKTKNIVTSMLLAPALLCSAVFTTGCGSDKTAEEIIELVKSPLLPY